MSRFHGPDGNDDDVAVGARASGVNTVALICSLKGKSSIRWNQTGFVAFSSAESAGRPDQVGYCFDSWPWPILLDLAIIIDTQSPRGEAVLPKV
ncbi:hypothetical protein PHISCL_04542 [Aspergillus sclerotialis]|uniref:Uncharacterized protein n=1 Tax=Aspergillus sclerotialis TaxID=2070753 RepID=A0A3A3A1E2_9EURO|nr:hypothetical protein PHISCL_04542 [Aspergillus sclerotialis]